MDEPEPGSIPKPRSESKPGSEPWKSQPVNLGK